MNKSDNDYTTVISAFKAISRFAWNNPKPSLCDDDIRSIKFKSKVIQKAFKQALYDVNELRLLRTIK